MTKKLIDFAKQFLMSTGDPKIFCSQYIATWKKESAKGLNKLDDDNTSWACSTIFCHADMFDPSDETRVEGEYDEKKLRLEIKKTLDEYGF
jgi:hypothetical protein